MDNRPEDMPKVVVLSMAIIAVFSVFVWQRVHGREPEPSAPPRQTATPSATQTAAQAAMETVTPGQMRLLSDTTLDSDHGAPASVTDRTDAFQPLDTPKQTSHAAPQFGLPLLPPLTGLPEPFPMAGPPVIARLPSPVRHLSAVTLDGVLSGSQSTEMEAVCTLRDPSAVDPVLSEQTLFLHVGDTFDGRRIDTIDPSGIQLHGSGWWQIGQSRHFADAKIIPDAVDRATRNQEAAALRNTRIRPSHSPSDESEPVVEEIEQPADRLANH